MRDFSNNRAVNHKHHEIVEHDNNDGTKNNSQSKHEERKGNQHKQKKETKEMKNIIKNSITPALTVFAVAMAFVFSLGFTSRNTDKTRFDNDTFARTFSADNFKGTRIDSDKGTRAKTNQRADRDNIFDVDDNKDARADFIKVNFVRDDRDNSFNVDKAKADISRRDAKRYDGDAKQLDVRNQKFSDNKIDQKFARRDLDKYDNYFDKDDLGCDDFNA